MATKSTADLPSTNPQSEQVVTKVTTNTQPASGAKGLTD